MNRHVTNEDIWNATTQEIQVPSQILSKIVEAVENGEVVEEDDPSEMVHDVKLDNDARSFVPEEAPVLPKRQVQNIREEPKRAEIVESKPTPINRPSPSSTTDAYIFVARFTADSNPGEILKSILPLLKGVESMEVLACVRSS